MGDAVTSCRRRDSAGQRPARLAMLWASGAGGGEATAERGQAIPRATQLRTCQRRLRGRGEARNRCRHLNQDPSLMGSPADRASLTRTR